MIMPEFLLKKGTRFLGYYKNGLADGTFWIGMLGGFPSPRLHGTISNTIGYISGNNLSYIFPDMETSYVGKFENRVMREARFAKVKDLKCDTNGLPYISTFSNESLDAIFYCRGYMCDSSSLMQVSLQLVPVLASPTQETERACSTLVQCDLLTRTEG